MDSFGINKEEFELRKCLREGETEISERLFNLIFGATLMWGFLINVILVSTLQTAVVKAVYSAGSLGLIMIMILYIGFAIWGNSLIHKQGLLSSLIGFNLIAIPIGLLLCVAVYGYSPTLIKNAMTITLITTLIMTILGMLFPQFFTGIAKLLGMSLLCCLIASVICSLCFPRMNMDFFDWVVAGLMCLYIGYDWGRLSSCARTANNAVDIAANLYLDIINLFLRVLNILAKSRRND